jgi:hypothetical protein
MFAIASRNADVFEGVRLDGPFTDYESAAYFAERFIKGDWQVLEVKVPEQESDKEGLLTWW